MSTLKYIKEDLYRYEGRWSWYLFFRYFIFTPGFRYTCLWRWTRSAWKVTRPFWILLLRHYQIKYGFQIPYTTNIGRGFRISHWGHIVINPATRIGDNFNIAQGSLIGYAPAGKRQNKEGGGSPSIGHNVCVGANSTIIGNISIGNNCIIAPGAFVNTDMPDDTIALGNPATFHHKPNASSSLIVYALDSTP